MKILKILSKIVRRAITRDGGNLLTLTNEVGKWDLIAAGALAVRVALAVLILYVAKLTGFSTAEIIDLVTQLGGTN